LPCNFSLLSNRFYIDRFILYFCFVISSTHIVSHCQNEIIIVESDLDVWLVYVFFPFSLFSFSLSLSLSLLLHLLACLLLRSFFTFTIIITTKTRERQHRWRRGERRAIECAHYYMHFLYRRVLSSSAATWRPSHIVNPISIIIYLIQTNWLKRKR